MPRPRRPRRRRARVPGPGLIPAVPAAPVFRVPAWAGPIRALRPTAPRRPRHPPSPRPRRGSTRSRHRTRSPTPASADVPQSAGRRSDTARLARRRRAATSYLVAVSMGPVNCGRLAFDRAVAGPPPRTRFHSAGPQTTVSGFPRSHGERRQFGALELDRENVALSAIFNPDDPQACDPMSQRFSGTRPLPANRGVTERIFIQRLRRDAAIRSPETGFRAPGCVS